MAGPGFDTLNRAAPLPSMPSTRLRRTTLSRYVPETFPHQWLPEKLELKTWEQIEPWYQKLMDQPIETGRGPRALGGRGR